MAKPQSMENGELGMGAVNRLAGKIFHQTVSKLTKLKPKMAAKMAVNKKLKFKKRIEYYNQFIYLLSSVCSKKIIHFTQSWFDTLSNCEGCLIRSSEAKAHPYVTASWQQPW